MSCYALIDEITEKIIAKLPPQLSQLKQGIETNIRSVLQNVFTKLHLVTEDDFNKKCKKMEYYEQKIAKLEQKLLTLEQRIMNKPIDN